MSATARNQVFSAVHTVGGLLPADVLVRISEGKDVSGSKPADYRVIGARSVRDDAERHWGYLRSIWVELREKLPAARETDVRADPTGLARTQWLEPLFNELGFGSLASVGAADISSDDGSKAFAISHRWNHVPIHLIGWNAKLDARPAPGTVPPQSLVQECLNRTDAHLWAVLSNGRQLRLLRDSNALVTASYVEFDLEAIFDGELFSEFVLLYRLLHVSRFEVPGGESPSGCWLEKWRIEAVQTGIRALKQIRSGVQEAITALGTGFLEHPNNGRLREDLDVEAFQHALLRFIYRLMFVFVAEDRRILHPPTAGPLEVERYRRYFSTARLRRVARRRRGTTHSDLYQGLRLVLDSLGRDGGRPEIGIPALGGIFEETDDDRVLRGLLLSNEALLTAVRQLSEVRDAQSNRLRTVDYQHLGAEELGSIYEFLLELRLTPASDRRSARMVQVGGNARKTTGSFYTHTAIIESLLDSALNPVLDDAVTRGIERTPGLAPDARKAAMVEELLAVSVCDPACGSGHFLVAAARRIAKRIASVQEDTPEPGPAAVRNAMWDVATHCIYGVDLNPMAVELAKVSLWLEALEPGRPLGFLDAHLKQGNALVGATPAALAGGIPAAAFTAVEGDDRATANDWKGVNRREHEGQATLFGSPHETRTLISNAAFAAELHRITTRPATTLSDVQTQSADFTRWRRNSDYLQAVHLADAWCSAFFWPKTPDAPRPVTQEILRALAAGEAVSQDTHAEITRLARRYSFFHWHLEFPEIFQLGDQATGEAGWAGGFSCLLGNPPWDSLSPDEKEFFSTYNPEIRGMKGEDRAATIAGLLERPGILQRWTNSRRDTYSLVNFLKNSGRYRLFAPGNLGKGDFNIYRMFVESALTLTVAGGSAAQVTPSGIYNGANAQAIRAELFTNWHLKLIAGFINTGEEWFDGADSTMRFGAYSARRSGSTKEFSVAFQLKNPADLARALENPPTTSVELVRSQSQDALAIGDTLGGEDATITDHLYRQWPAFSTESEGFPRRVYQREIDMDRDRHRYTDKEPGIALYEGRMVAQYDHRAKAYISGSGRSAVWQELEFGTTEKTISPQWVVPERYVPGKVKDRITRYRLGFCDVTSPRNERSLVAALIPPQVLCGHKVPTILFPEDMEWAYLPWLAVANSLCMDFLARKKVTLTMAFNVVDSLPFPRLPLGDPILDELATLVLRLTCTGPEMTPFWNRMAGYGWVAAVPAGETPPDALTDDASRAEAQARVDALVARHLYRLDRSQVQHVLETFPTMARKEERKYGHFRTRGLVLKAFDES